MPASEPAFARRSALWLRRLRPLLGLVLLLVCGLALTARPAWAALDDDRYDGNIYALYAGNGSLVPPRSSLAQALEDRRVSVLVYYLDDSSASKRFAAVVSELQRLWGQSVELMPLVTDPLQDRPDRGPADPAHYWHGEIPQVVVLDAAGKVVFEASGQVPVQQINAAISRATGLTLPASALAGSVTGSFNELNSEVVPGS